MTTRVTNEKLLKLTHPNFRFTIEIDGSIRAVFTECTLPTIEWEVEELKEGGLNTYVHQLPGRRKPARLTLKNGVGKSELFDWYLEAMTETIKARRLTVTLLDVGHNEVLSWHIDAAYPIKWTGPQLKVDSNTIAIQTLELVCRNVTVSAAS